MKSTYSITEYGSFAPVRGFEGYSYIPTTFFGELKKFILLNRDSSDDALDLMGIYYKKV